MSIENVKTFFERVRTEPAMRAKLQAVKATNKEEATLALIRIASEAGLEFDAEDYEAANKAHQGAPPRQPPRRV